ncbi:zinc finger and BTB domain-containing protein 8B [Osmerus mordax]|uniref:zinc finger and BTB domain-containing protein 8B n=1 Tax=Osmerus mordax TaxID=8014 RepID=UPI00350F28DD
MEVPSYQARLLSELDEQRRRDFFCDCSILVEGRVFKAHRNILFASSGYFRALLVHYLQDSGQGHSTASLDIVTAEAFSSILDFLYSGRLGLNSSNVIEVMSAASYLQMTDVVSFCKTYIRSSLEICSREREEGKERHGGSGEADSGTPALPPAPSTLPPSPPGPLAAPSLGPCGGPAVVSDASNSMRHPSAAVPSATGAVRDSESDGSPRRECLSVGGQGPRDHSQPSSSSTSSGLSLVLVHPKIEYDPDEELTLSSDDKDLFSNEAPHHDRLLPSSSNPSGEHSTLGYTGYHALDRRSSPHRDRGEQAQMLAQGMSFGPGTGRVDEGLGLGPSSMEIHSDWYGEDTGDGLLVPVKLHRCPFCPYAAKQKGILKRHVRCHTGERPFPCQLCGKRFTRQEHLRSHALSVHRSSWPVVCKGCRRSFSGVVSSGLKRFGLCDSCTCVSTTHQDPTHLDQAHHTSQPGDGEHGDGDTDWSSFMEDVEEVEVGANVEERLEERRGLHTAQLPLGTGMM